MSPEGPGPEEQLDDGRTPEERAAAHQRMLEEHEAEDEVLESERFGPSKTLKPNVPKVIDERYPDPTPLDKNRDKRERLESERPLSDDQS